MFRAIRHIGVAFFGWTILVVTDEATAPATRSLMWHSHWVELSPVVRQQIQHPLWKSFPMWLSSCAGTDWSPDRRGPGTHSNLVIRCTQGDLLDPASSKLPSTVWLTKFTEFNERVTAPFQTSMAVAAAACSWLMTSSGRTILKVKQNATIFSCSSFRLVKRVYSESRSFLFVAFNTAEQSSQQKRVLPPGLCYAYLITRTTWDPDQDEDRLTRGHHTGEVISILPED